MKTGNWYASLASLKLTLVIIVLFAGCVVAVYLTELSPSWILAFPLFLFAVNLLAAILTNPKFRSQMPLLVFHLALLSLVLLLVVSRLTYLKGHVEITEGEMFNGQLTKVEYGPFHSGDLSQVRFKQLDFRIYYSPGMNRGKTDSHIIWSDKNGNQHDGVIGSHIPLVLSGYRFYTTHNKGFAPLFVWQPNNSSSRYGVQSQSGSIHFPSYPANEYQQALDWVIPGTQHHLWTMLEINETVIDKMQGSVFKPPAKHHLVMRYAGQRVELKPGDYLQLPDGKLHYQELRAWMGYEVFYDWTMPWLLAVCLVNVLALSWYYWQKYASRPWQCDDNENIDGK